MLRGEFEVPETAELVKLTASPLKAGTFGREGLEIRAEFRLGGGVAYTFLDKCRKDRRWKESPVPDRLIGRLRAVWEREPDERFSKEQEAVIGDSTGGEKSLAGSAAARMMEWRTLLHLDTPNLYYSCRTAGDNIMHAARRQCDERKQKLNDFMLAVFDANSRRIFITVKTAY